MANSLDPDQTAPIGAVCSGSTLVASILNSSVMLGNYLQQAFFLGALRINGYICRNRLMCEERECLWRVYTVKPV